MALGFVVPFKTSLGITRHHKVKSIYEKTAQYHTDKRQIEKKYLLTLQKSLAFAYHYHTE